MRATSDWKAYKADKSGALSVAGAFSLGGGKSVADAEQSISRVKFNILVRLP
jgi:hypothetical protein